MLRWRGHRNMPRKMPCGRKTLGKLKSYLLWRVNYQG